MNSEIELPLGCITKYEMACKQQQKYSISEFEIRPHENAMVYSQPSPFTRCYALIYVTSHPLHQLLLAPISTFSAS